MRAFHFNLKPGTELKRKKSFITSQFNKCFMVACLK